MADRSILRRDVVAAGATSTIDTPAIPDGAIVTIRKFGVSEPNIGDNKSSTFVLRWGSPGSFTIVRALHASGSPHEIVVNKRVTGNGTRFLRVEVTNASAAPKEVFVWLDLFTNE
jgi:hypothetical protein